MGGGSEGGQLAARRVWEDRGMSASEEDEDSSSSEELAPATSSRRACKTSRLAGMDNGGGACPAQSPPARTSKLSSGQVVLHRAAIWVGGAGHSRSACNAPGDAMGRARAGGRPGPMGMSSSEEEPSEDGHSIFARAQERVPTLHQHHRPSGSAAQPSAGRKKEPPPSLVTAGLLRKRQAGCRLFVTILYPTRT